MLGIHINYIKTNENGEIDETSFIGAVDKNSIVAILNCPDYFLHVSDPISRLAQVLSGNKVPVHIDAKIEYMANLGKNIGFDERGISSISMDLGCDIRASALVFKTHEFVVFDDSIGMPCDTQQQLPFSMRCTISFDVLKELYAYLFGKGHISFKKGWNEVRDRVTKCKMQITQGRFKILGDSAPYSISIQDNYKDFYVFPTAMRDPELKYYSETLYKDAKEYCIRINFLPTNSEKDKKKKFDIQVQLEKAEENAKSIRDYQAECPEPAYLHMLATTHNKRDMILQLMVSAQNE